MNAADFDRIAKANDRKIVLVKFRDGVTRLYKISHTDEPGRAEFYSVDLDPHELPTGDKPFGFSSDYVEDLISISACEAEPTT
jgi:hypothetical protein